MAEANTTNKKPSRQSSLISPPQTPNTPSTTEKFLLDFHTHRQSTVENFIIIWLNTNINICHEDYYPTITRLQHFVHLILPFNDRDECVDFMTDITNEKIFLIISGSLGQIITPFIKHLNQIDSIYIYCNSKSVHEKWAKNEKKIRGVFTKIESIYDILRRDIRQCEDDLIPLTILSSTYTNNDKLTESDQLFIYLQLFNEILIEMNYEKNLQQDFIDFCRLKYKDNISQLDLIEEFNNDYRSTSSIWWYTRECFIYSMLNKAVRIRDIEMINRIGFFIQDIHKQIQQLYSKSNKQDRLIVYRGQGILHEEIQKIIENQNGLLSFNNFLLTTFDKQASLIYANSARDDHGLIGVLFQMEIDRSKPLSTPLTPLDKLSYYSELDKEILFSTHTIFRIKDVQAIQNDLYEIKLTLINNRDARLEHVKELMRKEIRMENGSQSLEKLMIELQMFDKSKVVKEMQLRRMSSEEQMEDIVHDEQSETANQEIESDRSAMDITSTDEQSTTLAIDPDL